MRSSFRSLCAAVAFAAPAFAVTVRADEGAALFRQHCAMCHGADGKAQTPVAKKLGVRDLTLSKLDETALRERVVAGVKNAKGVQVMPAFGERLGPEEVRAVVAFVQTLRPRS